MMVTAMLYTVLPIYTPERCELLYPAMFIVFLILSKMAVHHLLLHVIRTVETLKVLKTIIYLQCKCLEQRFVVLLGIEKSRLVTLRNKGDYW